MQRASFPQGAHRNTRDRRRELYDEGVNGEQDENGNSGENDCKSENNSENGRIGDYNEIVRLDRDFGERGCALSKT